MILSAIDLIDFSIESYNEWHKVDDILNGSDYALVPWIKSLGETRGTAYVEPREGVMLISKERKVQYIDNILAKVTEGKKIMFERDDIIKYLDFETLDILSASQCQYLSENIDGI